MKKHSYLNGKVEVRWAAGKGRGVFAVQDIKKDELVEVAPVLLIPASETPLLDAGILSFYIFQPVDIEDGGSALALGYVSLYNNDSRKANCAYSVSSTLATIRAVKNIKAGTELTVNYDWSEEHWAEAKAATGRGR